jgi:hypothetical protein
VPSCARDESGKAEAVCGLVQFTTARPRLVKLLPSTMRRSRTMQSAAICLWRCSYCTVLSSISVASDTKTIASCSLPEGPSGFEGAMVSLLANNFSPNVCSNASMIVSALTFSKTGHSLMQLMSISFASTTGFFPLPHHLSQQRHKFGNHR